MTETTFNHPQFGQLTWSDILQVWQGPIEFQGLKVWLTVPAVDQETIAQCLGFLIRLQNAEPALRRMVAQNFLESHQEWNDRGPKIDLDAWLDTLRLSGINWERDLYRLEYDDDGVFDHLLMVGYFDVDDHWVSPDRLSGDAVKAQAEGFKR